jgi:RNA polymerase subunit RPABC4/transcription elongation factor Spt4
MLGYECRYCRTVKSADGRGCPNCGASWGSLKIIKLSKKAKRIDEYKAKKIED